LFLTEEIGGDSLGFQKAHINNSDSSLRFSQRKS